jgi:hypothetical protein
MRDVTRRRWRAPIRSTASAAAGEPGIHRVLADCPICRAPNEQHREGCFNCGSLLQLPEEAVSAGMDRLAVGGDDHPGRVVYVRV